MYKHSYLLLLLFSLTFPFISCTRIDAPQENPESVVSEEFTILSQDLAFNEAWGYIMQGRESEWNSRMQISDLCYFASEVNAYGELSGVPLRKNINKYLGKSFSGRVHTVSVCQSRSLTHFALDPQYSVREKLLKALLDSAKDFDGLQIDYELVPARDGKFFASFLQELKVGLGDKCLSVAVHARTHDIAGDVEDYATLANIVDSIFIMAYDEHWSGSRAGPVASIPWCKRVASYALTRIPKEKLVMGVPFYARSWQNESLAKAWYHSGAERIRGEMDAEIELDEGVPFYKYTKSVNVICYFDNAQSLVNRCSIYKDMGIDNIGFWRLGQEDTDFWNYLKICD